MAADTADTQSQGKANFATGTTTGAGAAVDVTLGFKPRYVMVWDETNATKWEKLAGQADANSIKTLPGTTGANDTVTTSQDTGSAIVLMGGNVEGDTYAGFQMSATLAASAASLQWAAWG